MIILKRLSQVLLRVNSLAIEGSEGITAIAMSKNKEFLAVANKSDNGVIRIYNIDKKDGGIQLKRKVILSTNEHTSKEYISLCFGNELKTRTLISLGGAPDYYLIHWSWLGDKGKVKAFQILRGINEINQVSMNPSSPSSDIIITGNNTFKYYNLNNGLQQVKAEITAKENSGSMNYRCHIWIAGKLYICTDKGEILLVDNKSCKGKIESSPNDGISIECVVANKSIMITGGGNTALNFFNIEVEGNKVICEKQNKDPIFISSRMKDMENANIKTLLISPNNQWLIISLDNNQLLKAEITISSLENIRFEYLYYPFHSASVTPILISRLMDLMYA